MFLCIQAQFNVFRCVKQRTDYIHIHTHLCDVSRVPESLRVCVWYHYRWFVRLAVDAAVADVSAMDTLLFCHCLSANAFDPGIRLSRLPACLPAGCVQCNAISINHVINWHGLFALRQTKCIRYGNPPASTHTFTGAPTNMLFCLSPWAQCEHGALVMYKCKHVFALLAMHKTKQTMWIASNHRVCVICVAASWMRSGIQLWQKLSKTNLNTVHWTRVDFNLQLNWIHIVWVHFAGKCGSKRAFYCLLNFMHFMN